MEQGEQSLWGIVIGAGFAALAALMRILAMPQKARPGAGQVLGRVGISWCAGWLVAAAIKYWGPDVPDDLLWGFAGAAGFFGDSVYLALGESIDKRWGTSLVKTYNKKKE